MTALPARQLRRRKVDRGSGAGRVRPPRRLGDFIYPSVSYTHEYEKYGRIMRQEERRARTTTALLDAATRVFARQGVRAATVDDVARAAGYTKGAVYANFGNKDALV